MLRHDSNKLNLKRQLAMSSTGIRCCIVISMKILILIYSFAHKYNRNEHQCNQLLIYRYGI